MSEIHSPAWYTKNALKIQGEVTGANVYAINGGIQAKLIEKNITLTFYYRTGRYHLSTSGAMVFFTVGKEPSVIMKYVNGDVEKAMEQAKAKSSPVKVIKEFNDKGRRLALITY